MQHISVILAHPYTHSLNAAIAATVVSTLEKNGYDVHFHDLYQEGFDPLLSGEELAAGKNNDPLLHQHQEEISRAHVFLLVEKCGFRTYINIKKKSAVRTASSSSTPTGGGSRPLSSKAGWSVFCGKTSPTPFHRAITAAACLSAYCRPEQRWFSTPQTPPPSANTRFSVIRSSASGKTASSPSAAFTPSNALRSGSSPTATKRHGSTGCNKQRTWLTNTSPLTVDKRMPQARIITDAIPPVFSESKKKSPSYGALLLLSLITTDSGKHPSAMNFQTVTTFPNLCSTEAERSQYGIGFLRQII